LRVLQICAAYKPAYIYGGPTMSVSMLSEQLVKAGVYTEVYTTTANGKKELEVTTGKPLQIDGVTVTYFKRLTKDHSHFSPALFKKLWVQVKQFDIVHIHAWWNLVSLFSCLIALSRGIPVVISPRGTLSPYSFQNKNIGIKWIIHNFLGKYLLSKSHSHVTSQREKDAVLALIQPGDITILPNFVKLAVKQLQAVNLSSSTLRLLFFSRVEHKKGLEILFEALPMVTIPYTLSIAGDGDQNYIEHLKRVAEKNNIAEKITWLGFQTESKFKVLSDYDVFVLPSYDENFGNAVIESLSVGTPVLISEEVGLASYVMENSLGWICKTNPVSVSASINQIAGNSFEEIDKIRKKAPDIIYGDFEESHLVKKYIDMYNKIIKNDTV
jgi:glycosyltransferase involved in cell wall biosynthesis